MTVFITIPDPNVTTWERWVAELVLQNPLVPYPPPVKEWKRWAEFLQEATRFGVLNLPDPRYFTDWRAWARRVKELVESSV